MTSREEAIQHFFATMSKSKRLMHAHFQRAMRQLNISQAQAQLLFMIEVHQPVSFKQLAHIMSSTPGAITQLVSPLVDAGYVTRTPDAKDRRVMYVSLTDTGKQFMRRLQASHEEILLAMMEEWTDEEIRTWVDIQDKMLRYLETHQEKQEKEKHNGEN